MDSRELLDEYRIREKQRLYLRVLIPFALKNALRAKPPEQPLKELPPQPDRFSEVSTWASVLGALSLATPIGWLGLLGAGAAILYDATEGHEAREKEYQENYKFIKRENLKIEQRNQAIRQNFNQEQVTKTLKWLKSAVRAETQTLLNSDARKGRHDYTLLHSVRKIPNSITHTGKGLKLNRSFNFPFTPDVIFYFEPLDLWIDLEVDEPWFEDKKLNQKVPNHYIGKDSNRDILFLQEGWVVIRFAEEQVFHNPQSCAKEVAKFLALCGFDFLSVFTETPDLLEISQWTESEALTKLRF